MKLSSSRLKSTSLQADYELQSSKGKEAEKTPNTRLKLFKPKKGSTKGKKMIKFLWKASPKFYLYIGNPLKGL